MSGKTWAWVFVASILLIIAINVPKDGSKPSSPSASSPSLPGNEISSVRTCKWIVQCYTACTLAEGGTPCLHSCTERTSLAVLEEALPIVQALKECMPGYATEDSSVCLANRGFAAKKAACFNE